MSSQSTYDAQEVHKFSAQASQWWDKQGPLKTLHDINATRLDFIKKHLHLPEKNMLDVGCGGGILSEALAGLGAKVTGIDASMEAVAVATSHAADSNVAVQYECTLIEDYDGQFDAITCLEMIEHVANPELILQHCAGLLKPCGLLFLSTLSRTPKAYLTAILGAEYILNILPSQTHDYQKFLKPSELLAMARAFSLELVDMAGLSYNPWSGASCLSSDVSVNYLMVVQKT